MSKKNSTWKIIESNKMVNPEIILDLYQGKYAGYVIHNYIPDDVCEAAVDRFLHHPRLISSTGDNNVTKIELQVASPHFWARKNYEKYFQSAATDQKMFDALFDGYANPHREIIKTIDTFFSKKHHSRFRPLRHDGKDALFGVFQMWKGSEEGRISHLHTDFWHYKSYRSLELKNLESFCSFVFCYRTGEEGGFTRMFHYAPTKKEDKESWHYYHYQDVLKRKKKKPEYLAKVEQADSAEVRLQAGDVLIFPANYYHEVGSVSRGLPRVTSYFFSGKLKDSDYIYWF